MTTESAAFFELVFKRNDRNGCSEYFNLSGILTPFLASVFV